ncbi:scoloptoxin SSD43-like [Dermacentor andersoni]|uniref:scoloptoxin SSD43-like n=1 Tax=Dermacentor andersoni TaxID=34620 RepID=UPI002155ADD3|nr:scoloptoxin SSD43-like [Dermacentor andersoni]
MTTAAAVGPLLLGMVWTSLRTPAEAQCTPDVRRKRPTHSLCKPPNNLCTIGEAGVDAAQRALIVNRHNEHRSEVAQGRLRGFSPAADMQELIWDDEIAQVAQAHANLCTPPNGSLNHDEREDRFTSRFQITGQNLAWDGQTFPVSVPNWTNAIDEWYVEHTFFPPRYISQYPGVAVSSMATGHFTQAIWAMTRYIGCGYVYYSVAGARYPYMRKYTCNYAPAGNYKRRPVYQEGATCSACPPTTHCRQATGLCGDQAPAQKPGDKPLPAPGPNSPPPSPPDMSPPSEPEAETTMWPYVTLAVSLVVVVSLLAGLVFGWRVIARTDYLTGTRAASDVPSAEE